MSKTKKTPQRLEDEISEISLASSNSNFTDDSIPWSDSFVLQKVPSFIGDEKKVVTSAVHVASSKPVVKAHHIAVADYLRKFDFNVACLPRGEEKKSGGKTFNIYGGKDFKKMEQPLKELCEKSGGKLKCEITSERSAETSRAKLTISKGFSPAKLAELLASVETEKSSTRGR